MDKDYFFVKLTILFFFLLINFCPKSKSYSQTKTESATQDTLLQIERKLPNPKSAMIRSIVFPGWGQWYNGKKWKAALVFATEVGIIAGAVYWNNRSKNASDELNRVLYKDYRNQSYWYLGAAILVSMGDAYIDAHLAGFDVSPDLATEDGNKLVMLNFSFKF